MTAIGGVSHHQRLFFFITLFARCVEGEAKSARCLGGAVEDNGQAARLADRFTPWVTATVISCSSPMDPAFRW